MKLYEIETEILAALSKMDDEGVLPDAVAKKLDTLDGQLTDKVDNILKFRADLDADADKCRREASRLESRANSLNLRSIWLKEYVHKTMQRLGVDKLKTALFTVRIQRNSRPRFQNEDILLDPPADYARVVPAKVEWDMNKVYEDWKLGRDLPKCITVIEGSHLRVS